MASSSRAALGSLLFFFVAPLTVAGLVPRWISGWRLEEPPLGWVGLRWVGAALIGAGLVVLLDAFVRFAREGRGTPAPIEPTERLVVSGLYRHTRNPMYVAVLAIVAGQALVFGSMVLLAYALAVGLAFHAFVVRYEEPTLRARYGSGYESFCHAVPRWGVRLRPWQGAERLAHRPGPEGPRRLRARP